MEVRVDEAGHGETAAAVDAPRVRRRHGPVGDFADDVPFDDDRHAPGKHRLSVEDRHVLDDERHGCRFPYLARRRKGRSG